LIGAAVAWNVVQEQRARLQAEAEEAQRKQPKRHVTKRPVPAVPAARQPGNPGSAPAGSVTPAGEVAKQEPAEPAPPPSQHYTWQEIEAKLAELRSEREERPEAQSELAGWYDRMAEPGFTASKDFPEHCAKLAEWREELPDSPTPLIALARAHTKYAWEARGTGYANTVTSEGWELFHTRIAEAKRLLKAAIEKSAQDGAAFSALITVAMAEGHPKEETLALLDEGRKRDPKYYNMYAAMANYLLPRWSGEPGDIERFAAELLDQLPGDDGLVAYAHVVWLMNRYHPDLVVWGDFDHTVFARAAEAIHKRYEQPESLVSFAAYLAWIGQDREVARKLSEKIGNQWDTDLWTRYRLSTFKDWCRAAKLPADPPVKVWGSLAYSGRIAFSKDGEAIWCGAGRYDVPIHLIDLKMRKPAERLFGSPLPESRFSISDLVFDAQRNRIIAPMAHSKSHGVVVWNLDQPQVPMQLGTEAPCYGIALHPERNELAVSHGNTLAVYDMETGMPRATSELPSPAGSLRYSPDGQFLASSGRTISVWDAESLEKKYDLVNVHSSPVPPLECSAVLAVNPDGTILGVGNARHVGDNQRYLIRSSADGQTVEKVWEEPLTGGVVLSPDHKLMAVTELAYQEAPTRIKILDMTTRRVLQEIEAHWGSIQSVAFSPNIGRLAILGEDGIICAWPIASATQDAE
jgi:WD40 repeat protein